MAMTLDPVPSASYVGAFGWPEATQMMTAGRILPTDRTSADLLDAVAETVTRHDRQWSSIRGADAVGDGFAQAMADGRATIGTPALSNVWANHRPFASCAAVPVEHRPDGRQGLSVAAESYYLDNMGSGFNLDGATDPVATLLELNAHAARVEKAACCERYVGNMAHLSVGHPRLRDFIELKTTTELRHFNLSVNLTVDQLERLFDGDQHMYNIIDGISRAAWLCGDPGIISLDRFNASNPLPDQSPYTTTAPCAEVGLAPGDTCLFGYVNLAAFATTTDRDGYNLDGLRSTVALTVRVLDDLLDASERNLANPLSRTLATSKRRIGISVCGYADLLAWLRVAYGSPEAVAILEDLLSIVHYEAVATSIDLAEQRGAFAAFPASVWASRRRREPPPTRLIRSTDWARLYQRASRGLRHSALTALPPSGRSSILLGVNPSIEPFLTDPRSTALNPALRAHVRRQPSVLSRTATELGLQAHLDVAKAAGSMVDESVSKTVNLAVAATVDDVQAVFVEFMRAGAKAVSVYRPPT